MNDRYENLKAREDRCFTAAAAERKSAAAA